MGHLPSVKHGLASWAHHHGDGKNYHEHKISPTPYYTCVCGDRHVCPSLVGPFDARTQKGKE